MSKGANRRAPQLVAIKQPIHLLVARDVGLKILYPHAPATITWPHRTVAAIMLPELYGSNTSAGGEARFPSPRPDPSGLAAPGEPVRLLALTSRDQEDDTERGNLRRLLAFDETAYAAIMRGNTKIKSDVKHRIKELMAPVLGRLCKAADDSHVQAALSCRIAVDTSIKVSAGNATTVPLAYFADEKSAQAFERKFADPARRGLTTAESR